MDILMVKYLRGNAAYRGLKNRDKNTEVQNVNVFNPLLSSPLPTLV
jgi:hypothetical protein